ncbi:THAP domain containing, apoptosis associated protein 2 [Nesidiocoris tenuis]|uniref:THAP domain containing, apoptosis associated protein 2 n=1 Tax=Nesidiocoris tenuis TaxID=355587 RepID=A0ABN7BBD4_9HEMI|nr:THAP domain containing, apoptosis associated protein 2 [Nesidiocoris tenuis]
MDVSTASAARKQELLSPCYLRLAFIMVRRCCICQSVTTPTTELSMHRFPNDDVRKAAWLERLGKPDLQIKRTSLVCSKHFDSSCLVVKKGKIFLKDDAMPRIPRKNVLLAPKIQSPLMFPATSNLNTPVSNPCVFVMLPTPATSKSNITATPLVPLILSAPVTTLPPNVTAKPGNSPMKDPLAPLIQTTPTTYSFSNTNNTASAAKPLVSLILPVQATSSPLCQITNSVSASPIVTALAVSPLKSASTSGDPLANDKPAKKPKLRYVGDFTAAELESPENAAKFASLAKETLRQKTNTVKALRKKNDRLKKRVATLKMMVRNLQKNKNAPIDYDDETDYQTYFDFMKNEVVCVGAPEKSPTKQKRNSKESLPPVEESDMDSQDSSILELVDLPTRNRRQPRHKTKHFCKFCKKKRLYANFTQHLLISHPKHPEVLEYKRLTPLEKRVKMKQMMAEGDAEYWGRQPDTSVAVHGRKPFHPGEKCQTGPMIGHNLTCAPESVNNDHHRGQYSYEANQQFARQPYGYDGASWHNDGEPGDTKPPRAKRRRKDADVGADGARNPRRKRKFAPRKRTGPRIVWGEDVKNSIRQEFFCYVENNQCPPTEFVLQKMPRLVYKHPELMTQCPNQLKTMVMNLAKRRRKELASSNPS